MRNTQKPSLKKAIRKLERTKVKLAYYRDRLWDIQDDIESLLDPTDQGLDDLERAIQSLSEQV